jgi:hypothetical protein
MPGQPKRREREGKPPPPGARNYRWRNFGADRPDDPVPSGSDYAAEVSTRHGAMSSRKIDPIAATLAAELIRDRPDLERFPEAVAAWSRAETRCLLLEAWFAERGLLDTNGKPTASESLLSSSERLAMQLRERLGLDPKSEAELASAQADAARSFVDLDALRARGREALKARRALESAQHLRGDDDQVRDGGEGRERAR